MSGYAVFAFWLNIILLYSSLYNVFNIARASDKVSFCYPSKRAVARGKVDINKCSYNDRSSSELGLGMNIFTKVNGEDANLQNANQNVSISLSVTSTVFQSEILAIATAAASHLQHDCKMLSITSDSRSALQSLQNPAIRTKTKLDCMKSINQLAQTNHLDLLRVPGHTGIQGNERADELANIGAALDTMAPDLFLQFL